MSLYNLFQSVGYYGFASWVPTLLIAKGIRVTTSLEYAFIIAIANPVGPLLGYLIADRIERKWQIVHRRRSGCRVRVGVLAAQQRRDRDRDWCGADAVQQLAVLRLPRLSGRIVSRRGCVHARSASSIVGAGSA